MKLEIDLDDQSDVERAKALLASYPTTGAGGRAAGGPATPAAPAPTGSAPPPPPSAPAAPASPPAAPTPPAAPPAAAAPPAPAPASPSSPPPPPPAAAGSGEGVAKLNTAMQNYAKQYKAPATKARWAEMVGAVVNSGNAAAANWKVSTDVPAGMIDYCVSWFAV